MKKNHQKWQVALFIIIGICIFLMPLITLFKMAFEGQSGFSLEHFNAIFASKRTITAIVNTLIIGICAMLISSVLGVFFALLIAYTNIRYKKLIELLILLPYLIPGYIVTLSWTSVFAGNGVVNKFLETTLNFKVNMYSMFGIIIVLGLSNTAVVYLSLVDVFRKIPQEQESAAAVAGYTVRDILTKINLRSVKAPIVTGVVLAFLSSVDNFAIPITLGSSSGISVLSTLIYEKAIGFSGNNFNEAAVTSLILSGLSAMVVILQWVITRKENPLVSEKPTYLPRIQFSNVARRINQISVTTFLVFVNIVPLCFMLLSSFFTGYTRSIFDFSKMTLDNYTFILKTPSMYSGFITSLILSFSSVVVCTLLGVWVMYFKSRYNKKATTILEIGATLSYSVPGIVLALSMIFYWSAVPDVYGTLKILFIAYITRYALLLLRGSNTAFTTVEQTLEEAAVVSGASTWQRWSKIIIPLIKQQVFSSAYLMIVGSFTELTLSSLLSAANSKTVGMTIFSLQASGENSVAQAYSVLVTLFILTLLGVRYYWEKKEGNR